MKGSAPMPCGEAANPGCAAHFPSRWKDVVKILEVAHSILGSAYRWPAIGRQTCTGEMAMHNGRSNATQSSFLRWESFGGSTISLISAHEREAACVEAALAALACTSEPSIGLKVAAVDHLPSRGPVFSGSEAIGHGTLASTLEKLCGRTFSEEDIVFLLPHQELGWYGASDEDALHLAIHSLAMLVASTAPLRARDTLYLSACCVVLYSLGLRQVRHSRLLEDFLRMWAREKIGEGGDPPAWDMDAVEKVRVVDPWAAEFMVGLSSSLENGQRLALPAPLGSILEAALDMQARATLAAAEPIGSA